MKRAIATASLPGSLRQKLEVAAAAGFDGVELCQPNLVASELSPESIRKIAADLGLTIVALQALRNFEAGPERLMQRSFSRARQQLEVTARLGSPLLLIGSNTSADTIADTSLAAEHLHRLAEMAAEFGLSLGFEALPWGRHVTDYRAAWQLVKAVGSDHLGLVLNSFHALSMGTDLGQITEIPASRIALVHVADAPDLDIGIRHLSRHYRCFPGQGSLPLEEFARRVAETGYDGYYSNDVLSDAFLTSSGAAIAREGMSSLAWLADEIDAGHSTSVAAHRADETMLRDIAFIEFVAEVGDESRLVEILVDIGFRQTHRHRSKDVRLYQLGGVNIILNLEPDSYAEGYFWDHGMSVCAIGFYVRNPGLLRERAAKLDYGWIEASAAAGELEIPSAKGPGGVLSCFVPAAPAGRPFYEVDFVPTETSSATDRSEVLRVDHVAHAVRSEDFLPTSLYFRSMLRLGVGPTTDLMDPFGIVHSKVARNHSGTVRLPFSTTNSFGAGPRRFIEHSRGASIQQIAIQTADIFATASNADPRHVLPIGENYYEDLAARYELPEPLVEKMKAFNILYDADADGALFHFYFREVDGLFFEILQRIGDYDGYGAVNASIRLTAQARCREQVGEKFGD
ncbi:MAG: TIM barrel protein [Rhodanobacter sp.]